MERVTSLAEWEVARRVPRAVIYKHSPVCVLSFKTKREVERFADRHPDVPVYLVDVVGQRKVAHRIAGDLGIRHESPQVIVLVDGQPEWHASHLDVTAGALAEALAA